MSSCLYHAAPHWCRLASRPQRGTKTGNVSSVGGILGDQIFQVTGLDGDGGVMSISLFVFFAVRCFMEQPHKRQHGVCLSSRSVLNNAVSSLALAKGSFCVFKSVELSVSWFPVSVRPVCCQQRSAPVLHQQSNPPGHNQLVTTRYISSTLGRLCFSLFQANGSFS